MRAVPDTENSPGYGRGSLRPHSNYTGAIRPAIKATELASGLAGEGAPAAAGRAPVKASRSVGLPFELAAVLCGHDPLTTTGAENARHDFEVWDLVNGDR